MKVPEHYQPLMPYLVVSNAQEFISFIRAVFDAEEKLIVRHDDDSIMHAEFSINGGTVLFGQAGGEWEPFPAPMFLVTDKVDELYQRGIDNGAVGNQPPGERGYGRAAGFQDKFGNQWWLNCPE